MSDLYCEIQSALSPHMVSSTELMSAMSSIWPIIEDALPKPGTRTTSDGFTVSVDEHGRVIKILAHQAPTPLSSDNQKGEA
jgi:hypothetical protein